MGEAKGARERFEVGSAGRCGRREWCLRVEAAEAGRVGPGDGPGIGADVDGLAVIEEVEDDAGGDGVMRGEADGDRALGGLGGVAGTEGSAGEEANGFGEFARFGEVPVLLMEEGGEAIAKTGGVDRDNLMSAGAEREGDEGLALGRVEGRERGGEAEGIEAHGSGVARRRREFGAGRAEVVEGMG